MSNASLDAYVADNLPHLDELPDLRFVFEHGERPVDRHARNCVTSFIDDAVAEGYGARGALCSSDARYTYLQLQEAVDRCANVLVNELGLQPGQRVLLRGVNHPQLVISWLATLKAGGVAVTTMAMLRASELAHILEVAAVEIALCDADLMEELQQACDDKAARAPRVIAALRGSGERSLSARIARAPAQFEAFRAAHDLPAIIAFTSGTTGKAKATVHTHADLLTVSEVVLDSMLQATPDDVFTSTAPLAFTFGLGALVLFPLRARACAVLIERPAIDLVLRTLEQHAVSALFTAPTMYRRLAPYLRAGQLPALRRCVSAGEHLPRSVFDQWLERTGLTLLNGIGSTEMLHIFLGCAPDDVRPGSTGKPLPGYEVRVVDADGNELPPGVPGLLAVRGPTGCRYLANPERQREYVRGGWNYTGDIFSRDDDGYFWFCGRADDLIVSAGHKIAAVEVENVLLTHPSVSECAVIGAPSEERGQMVKAIVVLMQPELASPALASELQTYVRSRLAPYKYPRSVAFVDALPRTSTGKVQRNKLRDAELASSPSLLQ